jgi:hypothetical protein
VNLEFFGRCGRCLVPVLVCAGGGAGYAGLPCGEDADCGGGVGSRCIQVEGRDGGWNTCVDCSGVVNGTAKTDTCGTCEGTDDSCAIGYGVSATRETFCAGSGIQLTWYGPSNHPESLFLGISKLQSDGTWGTVIAWAYTDPAAAGWIPAQNDTNHDMVMSMILGG